MGKKVRISEGQYKGLFEESINISYDNPLSIDMYSSILGEGLIKTYPFKTMMRYVREYFNIPQFYMHSYKNNGVNCVAIDLPKNKEFQERVDKAMNLCGYFESIRASLGEFDRIHYEPKFEEEEMDVGDILYHITHISNKDKIMRIGLCPYSKNGLFNYPSRIYFFKENTPKEALIKAAMALKRYSAKSFKDDRYCILKIDTNKLKDNIKFFADPNYEYGLYTLNNIPPSCIIDDNEVINTK